MDNDQATWLKIYLFSAGGLIWLHCMFLVMERTSG